MWRDAIRQYRFRLGVLIYALGSRSNSGKARRGRGEKRGHRREEGSGEAALESVDGVLPVSGDGEGDSDDVQRRTKNSKM
jgi:hypothetical protein